MLFRQTERVCVCVCPRGHILPHNTGVTATLFCFKAIAVSLATAIPELGTCVGFGVVVPPDQVFSTRAGLQRLSARHCGKKVDGWMDGWVDGWVGECTTDR